VYQVSEIKYPKPPRPRSAVLRTLILVLGLAGSSAWGPPAGAADFPSPANVESGLLLTETQEALERAKTSDKLTLLYFWADWCTNCEYFSQNVLTLPDIIKSLNQDFFLVSIDIDKDPQPARDYKVRVVPTLVFLNGQGLPVSVLPGAVPGDVFSLVLSYMTSGSYADMEFDEFFARSRELPPSGQAGQAERNSAVADELNRDVSGLLESQTAGYLALNTAHISLRALLPYAQWAAATKGIQISLRNLESELKLDLLW
jgi:thiol:disulfide interchange protein DsbD